MDVYLAGLVLLAAGVHATWNAVVKAAIDRVLTFAVIQAIGTVLGFGVTVFVALIEAQVWPYLIVSAAVHNDYYVFLLLCYRFGDLSEVYPVARGASPLFVVALAAVIPGEMPSAFGLGGVVLV